MSIEISKGDALRLPLDDKCVDLVLGSPPYLDARTYARKDTALKYDDWVEFMFDATVEGLRVSKGLVLWVCGGVTRRCEYQPGPEGLLVRAYEEGITLWRPCIWTKNGLPGTGGKQWLRNDWEYVLVFKNAGRLPWADPLAMATPPKYTHSGNMRNRDQNGKRCDRVSPRPKLANPGNVIPGKVGGGHMGHPLACKNEAPYPESLVEFLIRSFCPPGGQGTRSLLRLGHHTRRCPETGA